MGDVDVDGAVVRFEGRGVDAVELRRVAMAALAAARAALTEGDVDRYAIVHVVSAVKRRLREAGSNPPLPPEVSAAVEARSGTGGSPSAVLRVEGLPDPPP